LDALVANIVGRGGIVSIFPYFFQREEKRRNWVFSRFGNRSSVYTWSKRREGTVCLSGLEIDSLCIWKRKRIKAESRII